MEDRVKDKTARHALSGGKSLVDALGKLRSMWLPKAQEQIDNYRKVYPSITTLWHDLDDALLHSSTGLSTSTVCEDPLAKFKDHELIMALLGRGYACMKIPESGQLEVLKNAV